MVNISVDDVRHLANLSALALRDDELDGLRANLTDILNYIEQLSELDTDGVQPSYQVTGLKNVYREDEVDQTSISGTKLVEALAPEHEGGQIRVPKVL